MTETENELLEENQQQPNVQIVSSDYHRKVPSTKSSNGKLNVVVTNPNTVIIEPPDGGVRAWCIMISAFLCNGVIFGIINCYSVINSYLQDKLTAQGVGDASSKAALVGSLAIGTTFLLSPVSGILVDKIGLRTTTFIGGLLSAGGMLISSFCTEDIEILCLTYGVMFGLGAALAYTPTLAILGHYFKRYLGKVSGFVTAGSSIFTILLPPGLEYFVKAHGLPMTLRLLSLILSFVIVCAFVYKPLLPPSEPPKKKPGRSPFNTFIRSVLNVDIWKKKKYVIWAVCVPLALFGYFVPYVHMTKFIQKKFPGQDTALPVMCIGITSGIGRILFGAISDMPKVNRIYLQQLALTCIGISTIILPLTESYYLLLVFILVMGIFDGCFISLLGPISYEICGPKGATQAIGFILGLSSVPLTIGPYAAGIIIDKTGSYTISLILAGIPPIFGSIVMFLIKCVKDDQDNRSDDVEVVHIQPVKAWDEESKRTTEVPLLNGNSKIQIISYRPTGNSGSAETKVDE
ncbi:SLC16A2.2 family protein [Megaselia abdita]